MNPGETLWYGSGLTTGSAVALSVMKLGDTLLTNLAVVAVALLGVGMMIYAWGRQRGEALEVAA